LRNSEVLRRRPIALRWHLLCAAVRQNGYREAEQKTWQYNPAHQAFYGK